MWHTIKASDFYVWITYLPFPMLPNLRGSRFPARGQATGVTEPNFSKRICSLIKKALRVMKAVSFLLIIDSNGDPFRPRRIHAEWTVRLSNFRRIQFPHWIWSNLEFGSASLLACYAYGRRHKRHTLLFPACTKNVSNQTILSSRPLFWIILVPLSRSARPRTRGDRD